MSIRSEVKEMLSARTVVFFHSNDAAESKMTHEMLCFTIETGAGGREGR